MSQESFDVVVIGAGPGGYVAAIRCAQLGLKTAIVEKDKTLGGTCLNVGCIPSKALLQSSEFFSASQHEFKDHGIEVGSVQLNLSQMMKRKEKVVSELTGGVAMLMEKNGIRRFEGRGSFIDANTVAIEGPEATQITAKNVIIATGSAPVALPHLAFDGDRTVDSTGALSFPEVPRRLAVVGAGVIGLELGSVWRRLGSEVVIFEFVDRLLPMMDSQVGRDLTRIYKKQGLDIRLGTKVTGQKRLGEKVQITFEPANGGEAKSETFDRILVAVGRRAYTDGLNLEKAGIKADERGRVPVDAHLRTSVSDIFAIGDVIAGPMLAHKAEEEGVAVAEFIATGHGHVNYECVPNVIYTWPEVATVGRSEEELKADGVSYKVGSFPISASGRAKAMGSTEGRVKILADAQTDRLLGVHIVAPNASEMIAEAVIAMEFGGSSEDLARSFHAHPTLAESIREAALAVDGRVRQLPPITRARQ